MLRIDVISVLPALMESPFSHSIIKRAQAKGVVELHLHDLRDYTEDKHRRVDDYAFGGEAGMVIQVEPVFNIIEHLKRERTYDEIIYTSPDGRQFCQQEANYLSMQQNLIILCGHYKGIDHRIREQIITREISIGDYVLTGGELAAAVICDSVIRLVPGAMSDESSALSDSFQDGLLAPPVYTRPEVFNGWKVPEVLLSGDTARVEAWRLDQALARTRALRPDLLGED